ncbi:competence protein ComK [Planococcus sp. YIM B11945]|uniref:competence protein ComK n=1 Tax=Planococcus sp. YIM B11945 TaxID=3435410 RepID=UPI003D7D7FAA
MRTKRKQTVKLKKEYAILQETVVILPEFDENGNLHALLCNREEIATVGMSPFNLIDHNLRYLGSSHRGAIVGAGALLGNVSMSPIVLNKELDIILFPCTSPSREDCVWFSLQHVVDSVNLGEKRTQVNLSNGSSVIVHVSKYTFDKKVQRAYELRYKMQERQRAFGNLVNEPASTYHLTKDVHALNYVKGGRRK